MSGYEYGTVCMGFLYLCVGLTAQRNWQLNNVPSPWPLEHPLFPITSLSFESLTMPAAVSGVRVSTFMGAIDPAVYWQAAEVPGCSRRKVGPELTRQVLWSCWSQHRLVLPQTVLRTSVLGCDALQVSEWGTRAIKRTPFCSLAHSPDWLAG